MARLLPPDIPSPVDERAAFDLNLQHGHKDLVQAVAFNTYGDRCATGSVDGRIRVFNRHKDGIWRNCDTWGAHGGEILELQWLPTTIYPNLLASLGLDGRFKLWAEDPSAAPGRRFASPSSRSNKAGGPAFDTRSNKAPFRSFSMKHLEPTQHTYLALLDSHGRLTVYESEQPEAIHDSVAVDELTICPRPARGEEVSFKVRFDPNPEACYAAVRAGVGAESLGLVVAGMGVVRVYRSREVVGTSYGVASSKKEFYLAAEIEGHRGLVRDVAWAPGNIRGYDMIATACQDGFVRVFKIETPYDPNDGKSWSVADLVPPHPRAVAGTGANTPARDPEKPTSGLSASLARPGVQGTSSSPDHGTSGHVKHAVTEISKLDSHRTPVWRVGFDDDGLIMGSVGDDGRLICYRQTPSGAWAKSSELAMVKTRMMTP